MKKLIILFLRIHNRMTNSYEFSEYSFPNMSYLTKVTAIVSINWDSISCIPLSEDFVRVYQHRLNWSFLSAYQDFSDDFIREFADKVDWGFISTNSLDEDFIREFQHKVNWQFIYDFQDLSDEFAKEFAYKLKK